MFPVPAHHEAHEYMPEERALRDGKGGTICVRTSPMTAGRPML